MTSLKLQRFALAVYLLLSLQAAAASQDVKGRPEMNAPASSARLQRIVDEAAGVALARFKEKGFAEKNLAITLVDVRDPQRLEQASFRGGEPIYPASVIKLFYLAAAHRWLADGKLRETDELKRALRDMIVDSSNDATHYLVDALTETSNGAELSEREMKKWSERRNAVNRYFAALGYARVNINQKPWCEGPYGRERQFLGAKFENRNKLTTDATARLLTHIVLGRAVTPTRSAQMLELLKRDFSGPSTDADNQAHGFTGMALEAGARLWSKAGWTSTTRHDAAYVELPTGQRFVLVTFTTDFANERDIIPSVARAVIERLKDSDK
ncbi:MAG TPA: serine hydrolase [Pyrinomonadaceae bacterium]